MADTAERIDVRRARAVIAAGAPPIRPFDDAEKFRSSHLEGAPSLDDPRARERSLGEGAEMVLSCA